MGPECILFLLLLILNLTSAEFEPNCDYVRNDPDVAYFDVRLPLLQVPTNLTTYVCYTENIPLPEKLLAYHVLAFEPIIDNKKVMHHMLMFGCPEIHSGMQNPHRCTPDDYRCRNFLVQWSMGIQGLICSPPNTGVRFGKGSLQSMSLQIHWNNKRGKPDMLDSSGVRVYYTKKLRQFDLGNVQVGQNDLEIPPGQGHYQQSGGCSAECTQEWFKQPIYLTRAHIHMHYIGDGGSLNLIRNGSVVKEIIHDETYDYNRPPAHYFQEPVEVLPGDELRLNCFYNTRSGNKARNRTIYWGEGSDGEMCYAFITYYPRIDGFDQCIQFDKYDICSPDGYAPLGECMPGGFVHAFEVGMSRFIIEQCGHVNRAESDVNRQRKLCSQGCHNAISDVLDHPCMQGRVGKMVRRQYLPEIPAWTSVESILAASSQTIC